MPSDPRDKIDVSIVIMQKYPVREGETTMGEQCMFELPSILNVEMGKNCTVCKWLLCYELSALSLELATFL